MANESSSASDLTWHLSLSVSGAKACRSDGVAMELDPDCSVAFLDLEEDADATYELMTFRRGGTPGIGTRLDGWTVINTGEVKE